VNATEGTPAFPVGLSDTLVRDPKSFRVVPWGEATGIVGRGDATRGYPVGRSDETTS
jgi:hypothetical protein